MDNCKSIIKLCNEKNVTVKTLIDLSLNIEELLSHIDYTIKRNAYLEQCTNAAYGFRKNKYQGVVRDLTSVKKSLEHNKPKQNNILFLLSNSRLNKSLNYKINSAMFNIENIKNNVNDALDMFSLLNKAYNNQEDIYKKALRFRKSRLTKQVSETEYHFLDTLKMKEEIFTFSTPWLYGIMTNTVNPEDGDSWPILKELYPEHYI